MRKRFLLLLVILLSLSIKAIAGDNEGRISLGVGALYKNGLDVTLSYEKESSYHNCWEVFLNGYLKWDECETCGHICKDSFWKNYRTWGGGIAWKPCIKRGKNNYGSLRIGGSVGSDLDEVIGGVHLGYEHNFRLNHGWQLYCGGKVDCIINGEDLFRTGIVIGFKIPVK